MQDRCGRLVEIPTAAFMLPQLFHSHSLFAFFDFILTTLAAHPTIKRIQ